MSRIRIYIFGYKEKAEMWGAAEEQIGYSIALLFLPTITDYATTATPARCALDTYSKGARARLSRLRVCGQQGGTAYG